MKLKRLSAFSLLLMVIVLAGCAPSMQMSQADRQATKTIFINEEVKYPEKMHFYGPTQSVGMHFGLIGGLIGDAAAKEPSAQFAAFARSNGIFIEQIVRDEFVSQLKSSDKFVLTDDISKADAIMTLKVDNYGIVNQSTSSNKFFPVLLTHATLTNKSEKTIWEGTEYANKADEPGRTLEEHKENPELIREGWASIAKKTVSALMEKL
jgi:hypothetical protein